MKKNMKCITLIVLVVTIIILLILATIAINLIARNNGLFSKAQDEVNEQAKIKDFENLYDEKLNNVGLDGNVAEGKKTLEGITGNEKIKTETTDKEGNRIVVPAGFKIINPEATVNEGIVIEDISAKDATTVGNQFVWIPATLDEANGSLKYDRYAFTRADWYYGQTKLDEKDADGSYKIRSANAISYYYHEEMKEAEKQSIGENGGYYIGRYEVGCETARTSHTETTEVANVKAGLNVYNYITRDEAMLLAEGMYVGKSKLCSSYAWDTALQFIGRTYAVESTGDNCETGNLENTGYHAEKNIYDMGGNVSEWTTENCSYIDLPYVGRGGSCGASILDVSAGSRYYLSTGGCNESIGMRVTLYV